MIRWWSAGVGRVALCGNRGDVVSSVGGLVWTVAAAHRIRVLGCPRQ
jgi:hypothetical protein